MRYSEVVKIAREATSSPGVVMRRADWLSCDDYKSPGFNSSDGAYAGIDDTSLVNFSSLLGIVARRIGKKIDVIEVEVDEGDWKHLNSMHGYTLNKASPQIVIVPDNTCWVRFAAVKELMHLYAGIAVDATAKKAALVTQCAMDSRKIVPESHTDLDDETAAFYIAVEVLMPWSLRKQIFDLRDRFGDNYYPIAKTLMVPENIVRHFFEGDGRNFSSLSFETNMNIVGVR